MPGYSKLSVVAGLITVLFITAIALTRSEEQRDRKQVPPVPFPAVLSGAGRHRHPGHEKAAGPDPGHPSPESGTFGEVLWKERSFDLIGQIGVIFAGVLAVLALFRPRTQSAARGAKHE